MCQSKIWINSNSAMKMGNGLSQCLLIPAIQGDGTQCLPIPAPGIEVVRPLSLDDSQLGSGELRLKLSDNAMCDLVLQVECCCELHVKTLGPQLLCAFCFDELNRDSRLFVGGTNTAFNDVANTELSTQQTNVLHAMPVGKA